MQITEGEIGPFSTIKVPVIFTPIVPGTVSTRFKVMFKNQQCPTVSILLLPGHGVPAFCVPSTTTT